MSVVRRVARRWPGARTEESEEEAWRRRVQERQQERLEAPLDPPDCPPGWQVGPPTYVGVGVQKSGTSWWSRCLFAHPDAGQPVNKELRYFEHGWETEFGADAVSRYHQYFPRRPGLVTGEWTPRYMLDPWTPARLGRAAPDAKILVILRDPMSRLQSGLRHVAARFGPLHPRFVIEAMEFGRYAAQLRQLLRFFPREQFHLLQLELCSREPERELARTYEFVGLDPGFVPEQLHETQRPSHGQPVTLGGDLRQVALELYAEDLANLSAEWPELDLSLWPSAVAAP